MHSPVPLNTPSAPKPVQPTQLALSLLPLPRAPIHRYYIALPLEHWDRESVGAHTFTLSREHAASSVPSAENRTPWIGSLWPWHGDGKCGKMSVGMGAPNTRNKLLRQSLAAAETLKKGSNVLVGHPRWSGVTHWKPHLGPCLGHSGAPMVPKRAKTWAVGAPKPVATAHCGPFRLARHATPSGNSKWPGPGAVEMVLR